METSSSATPKVVAPKSLFHPSKVLLPLLSVVALFVLYLGTIGTLPLLGKDEPRYVQVAREMWERSDWVTPTLGGSTWFEKPVLLYWLIMASFAAFGVSEWAARLGPALCGLATIGLVYWMAWQAERKSGRTAPGVALWSALSLASCGGLVAFSRVATFDIVLTATITLALSCFFIADIEEVPKKRFWLLVGLWAGIGLSLLAKGLVGIILPGGVILLYLVLRRDWRGLARLKVLWGLPLALVVATLWYGPVSAQHGQAFINEFFVQHHFARYLSDKYRHSQPVYYYLPVMALCALPWTAFLLSALREIKVSTWQRDDAQSKLNTFALAWLVLPIAFFSLSGSKLAGYILPALPGAMLLTGMSLAAYVNSQGGLGLARFTGALFLILGVGAAIYGHKSGAMAVTAIMALVLPPIGAGIVTVMRTQSRALCAGLLVGSMLLSAWVLMGTIGVTIGESKNVRSLLHTARERGYEQEPVWQMDTLQRGAEFYAAGRLLYDAHGEPKQFQDAAEIARALPPQGAVLVLVPLRKANDLIQSPLLQAESLDDNGNVALLRVRREKPMRD